MRATLIGHATWLLETEAGNLLTDPVFFDPFEEGVVESCPKREVKPTALPDLAAIYLSHRHLDHLDFPTLATLDKALPVFCPNDPLLLAPLRDLGFTDLRPLTPFEPASLGPLTITPIPSYADDFLELGSIFRDSSGALFDQVDCPMSDEAMAWIEEHVGPIDVHLAMYASQNFGFFESRADADTEEVYAFNVFSALEIGATLIVPAAAGFRFVDDIGWLNAHLFPIAAERFIADLRRLRPDGQSERVDPGDTIVIDGGDVRIERQQAPFVTMVQDDTHLLAYDAGAPVLPLSDRNYNAYDPAFLRQFATGLVENGLSAYLGNVLPDGDPLVAAYCKHAVVYRVDVIFPEGPDSTWTLRFQPDGTFELAAGIPPVTPHIVKKITASGMADVTAGRRGVFSVRTESRRSSMVLDIEVKGGAVHFDQVQLPDLLMHFIFNAKIGRLGLDRAKREYYGLVPPPGLCG